MTRDSDSNPYASPGTPQAAVGPAAAGPLRATAVLFPPVLAVGGTLILWLSFASVLHGRVNANNAMIAWSSTLILSVALSSIAVTRFWPSRLSPLAMASGFVLFGIIFCVLEGDTSNGTDAVQMAILYGTLSFVPVFVLVVTRRINRRWRANVSPSAEPH